ncbi:transposable element Tcb2 transposase [Trichonephila clavipes]|uniref:Transposable element Tcb2 transposase n=1 Tax=Trichonephila clavipes TaxID=2585209 RepID=A0A8X6WAI3_TRICX|nr:transposable element Tcb2 transposase [Trichonephila clavipes]
MITNFFIPELKNHDVQELWFQQDGATCYTARATIDLLKNTFGDRLISRFGPVNWPPRSCDLTPLDYFLLGYVKSLVYADKPQTLDHLEDNIRRVIADIRPQMLEKVIENWTSRLDYILASRLRDVSSSINNNSNPSGQRIELRLNERHGYIIPEIVRCSGCRMLTCLSQGYSYRDVLMNDRSLNNDVAREGRRAVLLARWIVRRVPLEILWSSGHEKVPTRGKPGLGRPGRPPGERIEGSCGKHLWTPTVTRSKIRANVGVAIVPQTISRHLAEANLKFKRLFRALLLTPGHRQLRLQCCQARSMWNVTDWQKVVFNDESRFVLGTNDNRVRVWRRPGERYNSPTLSYVTLPAQLV